MTWHPLEDVDASFFTAAPIVHRYPVRLAVPPERVWASLTCDRSVADWSPAVRRLEWLTARPFGVGTSREVSLPLLTVREEFFRWDEGRGYSFRAREANRPLLTRFAEDYVVEPDGDGTLFTWTVAIEPRPKLTPALRLLRPVNQAVFGELARGAKRYFRRHP